MVEVRDPSAPLRRALVRWRAAALGLLALLLVIVGLAIGRWVGWRAGGTEPVAESAPKPPPPERLALRRTGWGDLPGWSADRHEAALPVLARSCEAWSRRAADRPLGESGVGGLVGDWRAACRRVTELRGADRSSIRLFFESEFTPYRMMAGDRAEGLFTGYYEPTLRGSRRRGSGFEYPLYLRPPDLVEVDLGSFRQDLSGRRIAGRVEGGRLRPFADRAAIDAGALTGRGLEMIWVADPVDAFFLHIQGSGRVELAEGEILRVGYAGQNGHPYTAIGRQLVKRGELELEEVSMQSIRSWLEGHPEEAGELLAENASYVFFREIDGSGPRGSLGVALTPERSLAVDRRFVPLGVPVWAATTLPAETDEEAEPWRRLMVAQDTGGAIRGPLRADFYWGPGERAAAMAGRMRQPGRLWLLLPRSLDAATSAWTEGASGGPPVRP